MRTKPNLIILLTFFFVSCSGYINRLHNQIDRDNGVRRKRPARNDNFDLFRQKARYRRTLNRARNGARNVTSSSARSINPSVKRLYKPENAVKQRYRAEDLNDNDNSGSLWTGTGADSYLFTSNNKKRNGDIVLINVQGKMKNEITAELKRAYPDPPRRKKKDKDDKKEGEKKEEATPAGPTAAEDSSDKVYDRVSSIIIEEINQDHLLLRGRKYLIYKNRKRMVEIQALISRRDVTIDDTVDSNSILESNVTVLR